MEGVPVQLYSQTESMAHCGHEIWVTEKSNLIINFFGLIFVHNCTDMILFLMLIHVVLLLV